MSSVYRQTGRDAYTLDLSQVTVIKVMPQGNMFHVQVQALAKLILELDTTGPQGLLDAHEAYLKERDRREQMLIALQFRDVDKEDCKTFFESL